MVVVAAAAAAAVVVCVHNSNEKQNNNPCKDVRWSSFGRGVWKGGGGEKGIKRRRHTCWSGPVDLVFYGSASGTDTPSFAKLVSTD